MRQKSIWLEKICDWESFIYQALPNTFYQSLAVTRLLYYLMVAVQVTQNVPTILIKITSILFCAIVSFLVQGANWELYKHAETYWIRHNQKNLSSE